MRLLLCSVSWHGRPAHFTARRSRILKQEEAE